MPSKREITDAFVRNVKLPQKTDKPNQVLYFERLTRGLSLVLIVSYGGSKTFRMVRYDDHGKAISILLGRYPTLKVEAARAKAWDLWENPEKANRDTFKQVADEWLKRDQSDNRSVDEVRRRLVHDVYPLWEAKQFSTIGRRQVNELMDTIMDAGKVTTARRIHSNLHRLFKWAVGRGIIPTNPMADMDKPGKEISRDRVLNDHELALVWKSAGQIGWPFGQVFKMLLLTGCRLSEIAELQWNEVDLVKAEINLAGERTKNGEAHTIALSPAALTVLKEVPRIVGSDFVFTTTGRSPVSGWSKGKSTLGAAIAKQNDGKHLPDWRLHDLRRSLATGMQRLGINLQTIEAVLNHISGSRAGVVGVYQRHRFDDEAKAALARWSTHIEGLVSGPPDNLVQLPLAG